MSLYPPVILRGQKPCNSPLSGSGLPMPLYGACVQAFISSLIFRNFNITFLPVFIIFPALWSKQQVHTHVVLNRSYFSFASKSFKFLAITFLVFRRLTDSRRRSRLASVFNKCRVPIRELCASRDITTTFYPYCVLLQSLLPRRRPYPDTLSAACETRCNLLLT